MPSGKLGSFAIGESECVAVKSLFSCHLWPVSFGFVRAVFGLVGRFSC